MRNLAGWCLVASVLVTVSCGAEDPTPTRVQQALIPPRTPVITEPRVDDQVISAADLHMECAPFADDEPEDGHACSDWEIWTAAGERVWQAACATGPERLHIHFGDGVFQGSHAD